MIQCDLPRRPIPICCYCGHIRLADGSWRQGAPLSESGEVLLSHGICPACYDIHVRPQFEELALAASPPAAWDPKGK